MAEIIVLKVAQTITIQNNELVSPVKKKIKILRKTLNCFVHQVSNNYSKTPEWFDFHLSRSLHERW